jgi:hypothetical protein
MLQRKRGLDTFAEICGVSPYIMQAAEERRIDSRSKLFKPFSFYELPFPRPRKLAQFTA